LHDSPFLVHTMCRFDLTLISSKLTLALRVSFVFPTTFSNVPIRFSHMFFSMCLNKVMWQLQRWLVRQVLETNPSTPTLSGFPLPFLFLR
jgi:hypothetical protein